MDTSSAGGTDVDGQRPVPPAAAKLEARELSKVERDVLEALLDGDWPDAVAARVQLSEAQFGGHSHGDDCFDLLVPASAPRLSQSDGELTETLRNVVDSTGHPVGIVSIWVKDNRLQEFDFTVWEDAIGRPPLVSELRPYAG